MQFAQSTAETNEAVYLTNGRLIARNCYQSKQLSTTSSHSLFVLTLKSMRTVFRAFALTGQMNLNLKSRFLKSNFSRSSGYFPASLSIVTPSKSIAKQQRVKAKEKSEKRKAKASIPHSHRTGLNICKFGTSGE